jgi:hypothetical protein
MRDDPDYDEEMRMTQFTRQAAEAYVIEDGKSDPTQDNFETLVNWEIGRSRKERHRDDPLPSEREWCDPRHDDEFDGE